MSESSQRLMDEEDVVLDFGEEERTRRLRHPVAVFFHVVFRLGALLTYLFCGLFNGNFVTSFILIILLLCLDFWTVKNISGRLLVGLRWWNYIDEEGKSHWVFESHTGANKQKITVIESRIFWMSLVICQIVWIVFFFAALISLKFMWLMVVLVGVIMNGANTFGYMRCKYSTKKQLSAIATDFLGAQVLKNMFKRTEQKT